MKTPVIEDVVKGVVSRVAEQLSLSDDLVEIIRRGLGNYRVEYFSQGDFTVATLTSKHDNDDDRVTFVGVSKRNAEDRPNHLRGRALALSRAVKEGVKFELGRARYNEVSSSPVHIKEQTFLGNVMNKLQFKA